MSAPDNSNIMDSEQLGKDESYKALIFLVDDQPIVGEAVRRLLVGENDMALHYCSNPAEAIEQAAHIGPSVILQDLILPGVDGLDMVQQFRAHPVTAGTPIVV